MIITRITPKQHQTRSTQSASGFASVLLVLSTGLALMIMLMVMYEDTSQSQENQKNDLLANDYQQREDAILRSLINITPNKAILCMQDGSRKKRAVARRLLWRSIFNEAFKQANATTSINNTTLSTLGINNSHLSANVGDFRRFNTRQVAFSPKEPNRYYVAEGTTRHFYRTTKYYPPALVFHPIRNRRANTNWPVISNVKCYKSNVSGWIDSFSRNGRYGLLPSPSPYFKYSNNGKIIAKQNWWAFKLNLSNQFTNNQNLHLRKSEAKEYILSIYEIPSQLAINTTTYTSFGTFEDGTKWDKDNIKIEGSIFAEKVKTTGNFSADSIASRKGVELKDGTNAITSTARDTALAMGLAYSFTASSDAGRMAFIPINRGLKFYDRFSVNRGKTVTHNLSPFGYEPNQYKSADGKTRNSTISPTSWDYYSIGANQCAMNLVVTKVASSADQTPTALDLTYVFGGRPFTLHFTTNSTEVNGIDTFYWSQSDPSMPFKTPKTFEGRPALQLSVKKLVNWLKNINPYINFRQNNSISVNVDYVNNSNILKPFRKGLVNNKVDKIYSKDLCLKLVDTQDLTTFTNGFSLVTNLRLIYGDDVNTRPLPNTKYPPLSIFSPEKIFGDSSYSAPVTIDGQVNTLSKGGANPVSAINIHSGGEGTINNDNKADLKGITDPAQLPPINLMNWLVFVREKHN